MESPLGMQGTRSAPGEAALELGCVGTAEHSVPGAGGRRWGPGVTAQLWGGAVALPGSLCHVTHPFYVLHMEATTGHRLPLVVFHADPG